MSLQRVSADSAEHPRLSFHPADAALSDEDGGWTITFPDGSAYASSRARCLSEAGARGFAEAEIALTDSARRQDALIKGQPMPNLRRPPSRPRGRGAR